MPNENGNIDNQAKLKPNLVVDPSREDTRKLVRSDRNGGFVYGSVSKDENGHRQRNHFLIEDKDYWENWGQHNNSVEFNLFNSFTEEEKAQEVKQEEIVEPKKIIRSLYYKFDKYKVENYTDKQGRYHDNIGESEQAGREITEALTENSDAIVMYEANTDLRGKDEYNIALSIRRDISAYEASIQYVPEDLRKRVKIAVSNDTLKYVPQKYRAIVKVVDPQEYNNQHLNDEALFVLDGRGEKEQNEELANAKTAEERKRANDHQLHRRTDIIIDKNPNGTKSNQVENTASKKRNNWKADWNINVTRKASEHLNVYAKADNNTNTGNGDHEVGGTITVRSNQTLAQVHTTEEAAKDKAIKQELLDQATKLEAKASRELDEEKKQKLLKEAKDSRTKEKEIKYHTFTPIKQGVYKVDSDAIITNWNFETDDPATVAFDISLRGNDKAEDISYSVKGNILNIYKNNIPLVHAVFKDAKSADLALSYAVANVNVIDLREMERKIAAGEKYSDKDVTFAEARTQVSDLLDKRVFFDNLKEDEKEIYNKLLNRGVYLNRSNPHLKQEISSAYQGSFSQSTINDLYTKITTIAEIGAYKQQLVREGNPPPPYKAEPLVAYNKNIVAKDGPTKNVTPAHTEAATPVVTKNIVAEKSPVKNIELNAAPQAKATTTTNKINSTVDQLTEKQYAYLKHKGKEEKIEITGKSTEINIPRKKSELSLPVPKEGEKHEYSFTGKGAPETKISLQRDNKDTRFLDVDPTENKKNSITIKDLTISNTDLTKKDDEKIILNYNNKNGLSENRMDALLSKDIDPNNNVPDQRLTAQNKQSEPKAKAQQNLHNNGIDENTGLDLSHKKEKTKVGKFISNIGNGVKNVVGVVGDATKALLEPVEPSTKKPHETEQKTAKKAMVEKHEEQKNNNKEDVEITKRDLRKSNSKNPIIIEPETKYVKIDAAKIEGAYIYVKNKPENVTFVVKKSNEENGLNHMAGKDRSGKTLNDQRTIYETEKVTRVKGSNRTGRYVEEGKEPHFLAVVKFENAREINPNNVKLEVTEKNESLDQATKRLKGDTVVIPTTPVSKPESKAKHIDGDHGFVPNGQTNLQEKTSEPQPKITSKDLNDCKTFKKHLDLANAIVASGKTNTADAFRYFQKQTDIAGCKDIYFANKEEIASTFKQLGTENVGINISKLTELSNTVAALDQKIKGAIQHTSNDGGYAASNNKNLPQKPIVPGQSKDKNILG